MSKSILVIDMPKSCFECPCHAIDMVGIDENGKEWFYPIMCRKEARQIFTDNIKTYKPDWCPLKDVPGRMTRENQSFFDDSYITGRNACIDEILKEGEEN